MQCPNCQHENKEGASFCEKCGAQLVSEKKRMSFFERRQARERERQYILSKASLQAEDLENIPDIDMGEVEATAECDKVKMKRLTTLKFVCSIIVIAVCIGLIFLLGKLQFNATARVALIFVVFVICACGGAYAIDNGYKLRVVNAMCKSNFAVKKISYGKPPYMLSGDTFYSLRIKTPCDICGASMHIEEYNGEFIAVCDADRGHLRRLDCSLLNKNKDTQSQDAQNERQNIQAQDETQDVEINKEDIISTEAEKSQSDLNKN
ncbi:MAG: zinc ribbon domain-containing protein [Clostridia bacterium]|nr:zinc ribbon domain-containing protein [Clostridia bacterium]